MPSEGTRISRCKCLLCQYYRCLPLSSVLSCVLPLTALSFGRARLMAPRWTGAAHHFGHPWPGSRRGTWYSFWIGSVAESSRPQEVRRKPSLETRLFENRATNIWTLYMFSVRFVCWRSSWPTRQLLAPRSNPHGQHYDEPKFVVSRVSKCASSKTGPRTCGNSIGFLDDFSVGGLRGQFYNYWLLEVILTGSITMSRSSL